MKKEYNKKTLYLWLTACVFYMGFTALFSCLYPYGAKEYEYTASTLLQTIESYFFGYLHFTSRLGFLFTNIILYLGKWSFILINPVVQLTLVMLSFFLVFMRWPDFNRVKDIYVFAIIALLNIFAVAMPASTIFWISGACTYRWVFLVFLCVLCLFRLIIEHEYTLTDNIYTKMLMLLAGFIVGMSNKSNGPMGIIIFIAFFVYCKIKKIKPPLWFYWASLGMLAGVILLFAAPGPYKGPNMLHYEEFDKMSLKQKLFLHIPNVNDFMSANLFLPIITLFGYGLAVWDKKLVALRNIDFLCSVTFWILALITAHLLFMVPSVPMRSFYSASMFSILSFVFIIKYLKGNYAFNIYKYIAAAFLVAACIIMPLFSAPYWQINKDASERARIINAAVKRGQPAIWCNEIKGTSGPTKNLSINYIDIINDVPSAETKKYFGIELKNNKDVEKLKYSNDII